nr:MAG TPA: Ragulator complex protein LAMTOR4, Ragulator signal transduction pathway, SIGNALING.03A [Caudoviricetes sp.]
MYFNKNWTDSLVLPDGSVVSSNTELERYMREHDVSLSRDYSDDWLKNRRRHNEKVQRAQLFSDFIQQYKRSIWK